MKTRRFAGMFALLVGVGAMACATGGGDLDVTGDEDGGPGDPRSDAGDKTSHHAPDAALDGSGSADANAPVATDGSTGEPSDASNPLGPPAEDAAIPAKDAGKVDSGFDSGIDSGTDSGTDPGTDAGCPLRLVVNELQADGVTASDEFVELYNPTACGISLTGWTIRHTSINGSTIQTEWTGPSNKTIAAHGYAVVAGSGFSNPMATAGVFGGTGVLAATGGGIAIYDPNGTRVDSVGYGTGATNPLVEGAAMTAPPSAQSIGRRPNGTDTDSNADDFKVLTTPSPGASN